MVNLSGNNQSVDYFIQYFLSLRSGNDIYCLKHHCLCVIYKLMKIDFNPNYNINDLYNLQYNYETFVLNKPNARKIEMYDYQENIIKAVDLELRIQEIQNKFFLLLAEVLGDYEFKGNFGFV